MKYLSFIILILLYSCANVKPPSGGEKDTKAPEIVSSNPVHGQTNFKENKISIEFDEQVSLNNIQKELYISPYINSTFKSKVSNKKLTLTFEKDFNQNTTYNIYFRNSIRDLTEKNSNKDLVLTFATGKFLDSLSITGQIKDALSNKPQQESMVALYQYSDTINIEKQRPLYFTKSKNLGKYSINNIKTGTYVLYAINDLNENILYDADNESVGYNLEPVKIDSGLQSIDLQLFMVDSIRPFVKDVIEDNNTIKVIFSEPIKAYTIKDTLNNDVDIRRKYEQTDNTLTLYKTAATLENSVFVFTFYDLENNKNKEDYKSKINYKKSEIFEALILTPNKLVVNSKDEISFNSNYPIIKINKENIKMLADSLPSEANEKSIVIDSNNNALTIKLNTKAKHFIQLEIDSNMIKSIAPNIHNKANIFKFLIKKPEDYGIISGRINHNNSNASVNYIIELLDPANTSVKKKIQKEPHFIFNEIPPGTYKIRVIIDQNKNDKWDNGDFKKRSDFEKIIFHKESIKVKSNWEIQNILINDM